MLYLLSIVTIFLFGLSCILIFYSFDSFCPLSFDLSLLCPGLISFIGFIICLVILLHNLPYCPNCDVLVFTDFCGDCGYEFSPTITCPSCGLDYDVSAVPNYCTSCGCILP